MRANEILFESRQTPVIVVDIQPAYFDFRRNRDIFIRAINFAAYTQTGPVLMYVNAEEHGLTSDTIDRVKEFWNGFRRIRQKIDWSRFSIVDKGYGYLRVWMDGGISPATIIRVIRYMYQHRVNNSSDIPADIFEDLMGSEYDPMYYHDGIYINWLNIAQLRKFNGAYIIGGGREECLREVTLIMNAFNIKYRMIDAMIY